MSVVKERLIERTIELVAIPAPTFHEEARARCVADWWADDGVAEIRSDAQGNVIGCLRSGAAEGHPAIVICAHLDTVFSREVTHGTTWDGTRLIGPSVADDSVAVATLSLLDNCIPENVLHPIWISATMGEEGLGNLAGVNYLLDHFPTPIGAMVALEGDYLGRVNVTGVGSVRGRVELRGAGGHSWESPGNVSAVEEAALSVQRMLKGAAGITHDITCKSTINIGRFCGGESINSRAISCSFDIEMRSEDPKQLRALEELITHDVETMASHLDVTWIDLGRRPAGSIGVEHPLVRTAVSALEKQGISAQFTAASTDANAAFARSVPAITLGVAYGGSTHTEDEWIETDSLEVGFGALCDTVECLAMKGW